MSEVYPRFTVRAFLDPRDDEGHVVGYRVSAKKKAEIEAASAASIGDDYWPVETTSVDPPRFRIKMAKHHTLSPVKLADRKRPAFVGHYRTVTDACRAADNIVRRERGMTERIGITPAEVRGRMMPCSIEPILALDSVERGSFS